ncbi:putative mucin TcMUCII [Trypanosoma cruzi]|uniref:Mucin TcMUCII, putative n=2 Tax=Trypanosoma cruzi TaxID=5693 RepID=Q4DZC5_TRYCC|nr:mucin TcMUCII, putative [Trypanosoma cruzi]EAN97867.1 mucin TcMUCII, putative [Trypanosoma cruzi]PWV04045.1 putative mucin TcMUCII [Trypanosoma cruzi]RNC51693.1 mucin TcMUCII [Trypanosoma cruzi]|eukprot:XP_819718.1 mucin TcMUCII [Trypanosoma cruzi strain CL Brener]
MMMTCRLLCALLVLALCCCPSVCTSESPEDVASRTTTNRTTQLPTANEPSGADESVNSRSSTSESGLQVEGESGSPGTGATAGKSENNAPETPGSTGPKNQSNEVSSAVQSNGTNSATESQGGTDPSSDKADQGVEASAETTTTTTTKAPTTTTTTTAAPEAPSTTTTEAPTTTTTRAPSRLREIDGSLSSSACVCAPLLLAVSALAYTTLG